MITLHNYFYFKSVEENEHQDVQAANPRHWQQLLLLLCFSACCLTLQAQTPDAVSISSANDAAPNDEYGSAVAVTETMALIGVPKDNNETGSVYVRALGNNNVWTDKQTVVADDGGAEGDLFGTSIAAFGEWVIIGAPGNTNAIGKAYIFKKNGDFLTFQQAIVPSDGDDGFLFGTSVAITDSVAVIGASGEYTNGTAAGAAYVFKWNGNNWAETAKILPSDGITADEFGASVAISDSLIVVGARYKEFFQLPFPILAQAGAAYVFHYDNNNWSEMDKLMASDGMDYDYFGHSVGINLDANTGVAAITIGAYGSDDMALNAGAAYYYTYNGTSWDESKFMPVDLMAGDNFGWSVAMSSSLVVVGCPEQNNGAGAMYILSPDGLGGLSQMSKLTDSPQTDLDHYGYSVAVTNGIVMAGVYRNDTRAINGGSASMYELIAQNQWVDATDALFEDKVRITWQDRSGTEDGFNIYKNGAFLATVGANVSVYDDFVTVLDEEYEYCVAAFNAIWGESPLVCDVGMMGEVNAPTDLVISYDAHEDHIKLEWVNVSATAQGYYVFKNDELLDTLPINQQTYSDFEVLSPLEYGYCIAAFDFYMDTLLDVTHNVIVLDAASSVTDSLDAHAFLSEETLDGLLDTLAGSTQAYYPYDSLLARMDAANLTALQTANNWVLDTIDIFTLTFDTIGYYIDALNFVTDTIVTERELRSGSICGVGRALLPSPTLDLVSYRGFEDYVQLDWTNNAAMNDGYHIYRDGNFIALLDNQALMSYQDFDAISGSVHDYCVTAYREVDFIVENILSTPDSVAMVVAPGDTVYVAIDSFYTVIDTVTMISESIREDGGNCGEGGVLMHSPYGIVATDGAFETRIEITWNDSSVVNEKFKLYKDGVLLDQLTDVNGAVMGNQFSYSDPNVVAEQKYTYCVEAYHPTLGASPQVCDSGYIEIRNPVFAECAETPALDIYDPCNNFTNNPLTTISNTAVNTSILTVSGLNTSIVSLDLTTFITHIDFTELDITLTSPTGTTANYMTAGVINPISANFVNQDPNGDWILTTTDNVAGNEGILKKWSLDICTPEMAINDVITNTGSGTNLGADVEIEGVCVLIEHANLSDLEIKLIAPDGTELFLSNQQGDLVANYGSVLQNEELCFTPDAVNTLAEYTGSKTGDWQPNEPFANLDGIDPNGNWTLEITDLNGGNAGVLHSWRMRFSNGDCDRGFIASNGAYEDRVELTWKDESATNDGYKIFRDGVEIKNLTDGNITSFVDSINMTSLERYNYCVQAYSNTFGNSPMTCDIGWAELRQVTAITATDFNTLHPEKVVIDWTDASELNEGYWLFRDGVFIADIPDIAVTGNIFIYDDFDAANYAIHNYCVMAYNTTLGESREVCNEGSREKPAVANTSDPVFEGEFEVVVMDFKLPNSTGTAGAKLGYSLQLDGVDLVAGAPGVSSVYEFSRVNNEWQSKSICGGVDICDGEENGYSIALDGGKVISGDPASVAAVNQVRKGGDNWPMPVCNRVTALPNNSAYTVAMHNGVAAAAVMPSGFTSNFSYSANGNCAVAGTTGGIALVDAGPQISLPMNVCVADEPISSSAFVLHTYVRHPENKDVRIYLVSPNGTQVTVTLDEGGDEGNAFNNTLWFDGSPTDVEDIGSGNDCPSPFYESLKPEDPFSAFDGESPNGVWTLKIEDDDDDDIGGIEQWSLIIGGVTTTQNYQISRTGIVVMTDNGSDWNVSEPIAMPGNNASELNDNANQSIAVRDNLIALGASNADKVYLFDDANGDGNWASTNTVTGPTGSEDFGWSVFIENDLALVGDPGFDGGKGIVYGYNIDPIINNFSASPAFSLAPNSLVAGDEFGSSIYLKEGKIMIGAPGSDGEKGAAYQYILKGTTWNPLNKFIAGDGINGDRFGHSLGFEGNFIAVGAPDHDGFGTNQGAVYSGLFFNEIEVLASDGAFNNRVKIEWSFDPDEFVDEFLVFRDTTEIASLGPEAEVHYDYDALPGIVYQYTVRAVQDTTTFDVMDRGFVRSNGKINGSVTNNAGGGVLDVQVCATANGIHHALKFDGIDDKVSMDGRIPLGNADFTIECWAKRNTTDTQEFLFSLGSNGATGEVLHMGFRPSNQFTFGFFGDDLNTAATYTDTDWHHWATSYDESTQTLKIYRDGQLIETGTGHGPFTGNELSLQLGALLTNDFFDGYIDDFRIWTEVRSQVEIDRTKNQMLNGDEANLVAYYHFNEGQGLVVGDFSKNGDHYGAIENNGACWTYDVPPLDYCAYTDVNGFYEILNVFYKESTEMTVTPYLEKHGFSPDRKFRELSNINPTATGVSFLDTTGFVIEGTILTALYNTIAGPVRCPVKDIEIWYQQPTDTTFTDTQIKTAEDGSYSFLVQNPGLYIIQPRFSIVENEPDSTGTPPPLVNTHSFDPPTQSLLVENDIQNIDFSDITTRSIMVKVIGACNSDIGTSKVSISSQGGCIPIILETDGLSFFETPPLPPLTYNMRVTDVRDNGQVNVSAINYFESRVQQIDLNPGNDTAIFVFNRPYKTTISNLPTKETCPPTPVGYVLEQGEAHTIVLEVFQEFPDGTICPADSGILHIVDNVSGLGAVTMDFYNGLAFYTLLPDEPEVIAPHMKSFAVAAEVNGALTPVVDFEVLVTGSKPRDATFVTLIDQLPLFVLRDPPGDGSSASLEIGKQMCNETMFYFSQEILSYIKGELAFSADFLIKILTGLEFSIESGFESENNLSINACMTATQTFSTSDNPVLTGKDGDIYVGLGTNYLYALADVINYQGCEVDRDTTLAIKPDEITSDYIYTYHHLNNTLIPALEIIASLQQNSGDLIGTFQTTSAIENWKQALKVNEDIKELLLGEEKRIATGDLKAELIPLNNEVEGELNDLAVEDADGLVKLYEVSEEHLNGSILNFSSFDNAFLLPTDFSLASDDLANDLPWPEAQNYSFSAGANITQAVSVNKAWSQSFKSGVVLDASIGVILKQKVSSTSVFGSAPGVTVTNPLAGGEQEFKIGVSLGVRTGGGRTNTRELNTEISYTFDDDDVGDFFTVDVVGDPIYGTPVFKLRSGTTSCPWEPGTARRDIPNILFAPGQVATQLNVPPDEPATFIVKLQNQSQHEPDGVREYHTRVIHATNPDGAVIKVNGLGGQGALPFFIPRGDEILATVTIERGALEYNYENLQLMLYAPCEYEHYQDGGNLYASDTITFNVHYESPCSDVNLFLPQDNWLINQATDPADILSIVMVDYDFNNPLFQHIRIDYREMTPQNINLPDGGWINVDIIDTTILQTVLPDLFYTYNWNTSFLGDGNYEVKATAVCQTPTGTSKNTSARIPGTIDRNTFLLLGTAEPADGVLNAGEEILANFNSQIACDTFAFGSNIYILDLTTNTMLTYDSNADQVGEFNVSCNYLGTQLQLNIIDIAAYEGHLLQVIIDTQEDIDNFIYPLTDFVGNKLYNPITWSFIVQQNEVFWNPPDLTYNLYEGDVQTTTVQLNNIAQGAKAFQLDYSALPSWINVDAIPSNNLSPNGYQDITLHLNLLNTLAAGNTYTDAVIAYIDDNPLLDSSGDGIANNDTAYIQMLPITIHALAAPPNWNVNPADFAYSMNMITELNVNSNLSEDELDMLSAYVDGELRGFANIEYFAPIDKYLAFITIYNHNEVGDSVTFRAWDASDGVLYGARRFNVNGDADISFVHQSTLGTLAIPETMYAGAENVQCIDLETGWNLVSLNVTAADMTPSTLLAGLNPSTGDVIKTQAGDMSIYDDLVGDWVGSIATLNNNEAFYIQLTNSGQLCVTGTAVDITMENIPLLAGWNGVAYPSQATSTVDAALAGLNAADGDLITHPYNNEFAQYDDNSGMWVGSLQNLKAGEGYVLNVANASTLTFAESNALGWQYEARDYQYSMNVVGVIEIDALPSFDPDDQVGAFINGESRGYTESIFIPEYNRHFLLLTVFSNDNTFNETVEFRVYDASADTVYTAVSSMNFSTDMVTGDLSNPYNFAVYTCGSVALNATPETCTDAFDGTATADVGILCGTHGTPCLSNPDEFTIGASTTGDLEVTPFQSSWEDARFQYLFKTEELQAAGLNAGVISSIALNVLEKNSVHPFSNFSIKMKCTSASSLTAGTYETSLKTVYTGDVNTLTGWNEFEFFQTYDWDGSTNLVIEICFDNATYSFYNDKVATTTTNYISSKGFYEDGAVGCAFTNAAYTFNERPDIKFGACTTTFAWDDGQTTATAVGLTAGVHTVNISLPNSCEITASVIVGATSDLTLDAQQLAGTCGTFNQGVASVTPLGGIAPYTYVWSNGSNSETASGLDAGTHQVTVTDANNCTQIAQVTINSLGSSACLVVADIKVFLEGPYVANHTMSIALNNYGLLPLTQPYNVAPWNYTGSENVVVMPSNATDWILVEARNVNNMDQIVATKAALLLNNGHVQDVDGTAGVKFDNLAPGSYYIVIRHRNHLAVMSAIPLNLPNTNVYDFSQSAAQAMGGNQQTTLETGVYGLFAGDLNSDGVVTIADFNFYQTESSMVNQYLTSDCNLNRAVTVADFNLYQPNASVIGISPIRY